MSYICDKCGKDIVTGRSQQHKRGVAGKRWKKRALSGKRLSMKLCAKCIKRFEKEGKLFDYKQALQK